MLSFGMLCHRLGLQVQTTNVLLRISRCAPIGRHITTERVSGDPDLLKRGRGAEFRFISIPPVAQGRAEVVFELTPFRLMDRLGDKYESVQDKLARFLRPGDTYKIEASDLGIRWWAFESLQDEDGLKGKKSVALDLPG
ncbi:hypothetical protein F5Y19DRAFT_433980 [Xylariaceae sp. FL1651]|nr:hypothetical protein F5Y19DRAFT_433980 [Xylariaceae sp. FL1651]